MSVVQGTADEGGNLDREPVDRTCANAEDCGGHDDRRLDGEINTSAEDGQVGSALFIGLVSLTTLLIRIYIVGIVQLAGFKVGFADWTVGDAGCSRSLTSYQWFDLDQLVHLYTHMDQMGFPGCLGLSIMEAIDHGDSGFSVESGSGVDDD